MTVGKSIGERIAEVFVEDGFLTAGQVLELLDKQKREGTRFTRLLLDRGLVDEAELTVTLGRVLGASPVNLTRIAIPPEMAKLLPEEMAITHKVLPLGQLGGFLLVAMADPLNCLALDDVRRLTNLEVQPLIVSEQSILDKIKTLRSAQESFEEIMQEAQEECDLAAQDRPPETCAVDGPLEFNLDDPEAAAGEPPVILLVNRILADAAKNRASDIHLEPYEQNLRLRYRVDGDLIEWPSPPKSLHPALITRIKVMCNMDIAEKRLPQDGRSRIHLEGRQIDLRVSLIPTVFGEKCVLRILDKSALPGDLEYLGLEENSLRRFQAALDAPHGLLLVTGPTGSGKTTTLYSALRTLNHPRYNIITVEDPIEYQLHGINQIAVRRDLGLTFANALRSILRQDPDIIMIGEIRDSETAEIATEAALTGHQVLSTMHCNDAAAAVARLDEMGIAPFLIASAVILSCSQRLIQIICPVCKEPSGGGPRQLSRLGNEAAVLQDTPLYRGRGCEYCLRTGYYGRRAIVEAMPMTEEIRRLIIQRVPATEIARVAVHQGMKTLRMAALDLARQGLTSLEQVLVITAT
jgi:type IV pilus assembly protein PilB